MTSSNRRDRFLGAALATELVKHQQPVRILARDEQKARAAIWRSGQRSVRGDITDAVQVQRAVDGATIMYHLVGKLYHPSMPAERLSAYPCRGDAHPAQSVPRAEAVAASSCIAAQRECMASRARCPQQRMRPLHPPIPTRLPSCRENSLRSRPIKKMDCPSAWLGQVWCMGQVISTYWVSSHPSKKACFVSSMEARRSCIPSILTT